MSHATKHEFDLGSEGRVFGLLKARGAAFGRGEALCELLRVVKRWRRRVNSHVFLGRADGLYIYCTSA